MARLKARVETFCVGCGLCAEACPEVFELPEGAEAVRVKASEVPVGAEEACRQAADQCPVDNIRVEGWRGGATEGAPPRAYVCRRKESSDESNGGRNMYGLRAVCGNVPGGV